MYTRLFLRVHTKVKLSLEDIGCLTRVKWNLPPQLLKKHDVFMYGSRVTKAIHSVSRYIKLATYVQTYIVCI